MRQSIFLPHGKLDIHRDGRLLILRAEGPWNTELTELYVESVRENVTALSGAPWGLLGIVVNEGIHTPDSYKLQVKTICEHRLQGRVASAILFQDLDSSQIVRYIFDKLYNEADEPHEFFDDETAARQWLSEKILAAS